MVKVSDIQLKEYFPDLPMGPLDLYRKKATFDWRRMKLVYETPSAIDLKHQIWKFMESNPLFRHPNATPSLDEQRKITINRMYAIFNQQFSPMERIAQEPSIFQASTEALFMFDSSLAVKLSLTFNMPANTIRGSGTSKHYHYIEGFEQGTIGGCFSLTEIAHGSNAKGMRTVATYCPERRRFVLHTPDFQAAKCWVGSLGKCATHALVYAMLVTKGKNHGLHTFVVPIRDPKTLKPFAGVTIGDLGEKIGLNGVDNGFVMFNNYLLPEDSLLDKLGGVDEDGNYKTPFKDPKKRFGASLGILSGGRVHITSISTCYLQKAIVIAIRYSAVRKQFGPENSDEEIPVIEYQQQQIRLLPYLAATYAMRVFCNWFSEQFVQLTINNLMGVDDSNASRGIELHALSSSVKPICGWTARDGIQHCREACGGHGYLKATGIGELRNDNDANCTYEGENSLLLQQTSNWLLQLWRKRGQTDTHDPFGSLKFLKNADRLLVDKCPWRNLDDFVKAENLIHMYDWLTTYTLKLTSDKFDRLLSNGSDAFEAKNQSQSFNAVTLSVVYGENYILSHFYKTVSSFEDEPCKKVLMKLVSLFGAFMLEKHLATFYIGGYLSGSQGLLLRESILHLCKELTPEAVSLVDTLAPPDFCLNSVLGQSDGEAYKHIQNSVMTYPGGMSRPEWWRDVVYWQSNIPSKL